MSLETWHKLDRCTVELHWNSCHLSHQLDPGIRATPVDTASVATALHSEQPVVPPEGGKTVEVHRSIGELVS